MGRFDGLRPGKIPPFPENGTSGTDWLEWVDEFLDELFDGRPTFDDIREFLEDNNWEDFIPDKSDIGEVIGAIYDKIEDEINPSQYIPKKVVKRSTISILPRGWPSLWPLATTRSMPKVNTSIHGPIEFWTTQISISWSQSQAR